MGDNKGIVNIDLSGMGEAASKLIEKVADGIGGAFAPRQVVRMAKANAEADLIAANSQIEISDVQRRALIRLAAEEARKQENIEKITLDAIPLLEDKSQPENIDEDWIANFFEKSRIVSDEEMQSLWSRLLASEANSPGCVSKRAINIMADMDKGDAQRFSTLCNFSWSVAGTDNPLIFGIQDELVRQNGLNYEVLVHLESLGLLRISSAGEFHITYPIGAVLPVSYFGKAVILKTNSNFRTGKVLLTHAGKQIAKIARTGPIEGVFEYGESNFASRAEVLTYEDLTNFSPRPK